MVLERLFQCQNDWCGHGPAGQAWLLECAHTEPEAESNL